MYTLVQGALGLEERRGELHYVGGLMFWSWLGGFWYTFGGFTIGEDYAIFGVVCYMLETLIMML